MTDYGPKELYDPFPGTDASTFVQWKGSDICMDLTCPCGELNHYHGMFAHFVKCGGCKSVYQLGTQVRAFKVEDDREPYIAMLEPT